jgi:hypothetical protein
MVFFGSLAGSNTASINSLTTTGLVTTTDLRIGPATTVEETMNRFHYGLRTSVTVSDTGVTLTTITVSGMGGGERIFVTPRYTAGGVPSMYSRVYDSTAGSFRVASRLDDETPGTATGSFHWVVMD